MSRALVVQYACDAAACGVVVWLPIENNDPANLPGGLPGDWTGTARVQFCPKHAALVNARLSIPSGEHT